MVRITSGVRRGLAFAGATALLALWTLSVRSGRVDWDPPFTGLDAINFNPYWLGVSALELALPVLLLLLFSRTALFRRTVNAITRRGAVDAQDAPRLLLVLALLQVAAILYQHSIDRMIQDSTMLGYFVVLAAGLLGGWRIGLIAGVVAMFGIGAQEYLTWDWIESFSLAEFFGYAILENLSVVVAPWLGFVAGHVFDWLPPRRRFNPGYALLIALILHLGIAVTVVIGFDDLGYYSDRFLPSALMTGLALVTVALMARDVQGEEARRQAEAAGLTLAQTERDLAQTQLALAHAELRALHAQINPHFFFNSLNTIRYFIRTEPETARELLTKLSEIFQRSLSAGEFVSLREEINHVEAYLALEKARLEERLQIVWTNLAEDQQDLPVPTLILQPLVENAVIHGISPRTEGGALHIVINQVGDDLLIQIDDNGVGFDPPLLTAAAPDTSSDNGRDRPAIGLRNVDSRLRRLYGSAYGLILTSKPGKGTRAIVKVPVQTVQE
ncbi:MAG: histidine kinase [Caldilineaceae bacterium]